MYPLVKQGIITKHLAHVFSYTPPPSKPKSQCKVVKEVCVITSYSVKAEIQSVENKQKGLKSVQKDVNEETITSSKSKLKAKLPRVVLKEREMRELSELSDDESNEDDNNVDFEYHDTVNGDYGIVQYAGKCNIVYYAVVVTSVKNDEMFTLSSFKFNGKKYFTLMKMIMMKLMLNVHLKNFH